MRASAEPSTQADQLQFAENRATWCQPTPTSDTARQTAPKKLRKRSRAPRNANQHQLAPSSLLQRRSAFVRFRPEDVVGRIRDLGALFDKSPKDAREALKHLLDDGIQLHPLEDGRYRARWTVRGGALFFGGTTKPPVQTEGLEERSTLWVAGAGFEPTTFGL